MSYPKISVVTPVFNQVEYLEETINSVLSQGYPNLEYIIIDGGSTDGTVDIIKRYANQLHYWVSEPDGGMYEAIQKGFEHSTGDIMAWIGSDDMYHPRSLFTVGEIFGTLPQVNWLVGATTQYDKQGRTVLSHASRAFERHHLLSGDYEWIQQESCFWRRSLWEKAGGCINTSLHYAGDFELWLRFSRYAKLYITPALIGGFRIRGGDQLSQAHLAEYHQEVQARIACEPRTPQDTASEKKYKRRLRFCQWIKRHHLPLSITISIRLLSNKNPRVVSFDNNTQQFVIPTA